MGLPDSPKRSKTKQAEVKSLRVELSLIADQGTAACACSKQAFCFCGDDSDDAGIIVSAVVLVVVVMIHFSVTTTLSVAIIDRYQGLFFRVKSYIIVIIRTLI